MYGIFTYIYHTYQPNAGKYTKVVFSNIFYFHPYLGKWSKFDEHIFSDGLVQPPASIQVYGSIYFMNPNWTTS